MIILTGGAGFIGSVMLEKLNREGETDIIVVDNLRKGDKWKNLVGKHYEDYMNKDDFPEYASQSDMTELEMIIHLGACSATTERDADYLMDNNYAYSKFMANLALEYDVPFIYAGSAATYGAGEYGYLDDDSIAEKLKPMNCYGYSKHAFDLWVLKNNLQERFVGLKFFNVFGPNEYSKGSMASMVYKSYRQVRDTRKIKLFKSNDPKFGDGDQRRDFIYVKDVVDVIWEFMLSPDITGIFNLGTGHDRSWNDLAESVFSAMDIDSCIEYIDMPEELHEQYQNYTVADMRKIRKAGIRHEFTSLENAVRDYVQDYLMQGCKRI